MADAALTHKAWDRLNDINCSVLQYKQYCITIQRRLERDRRVGGVQIITERVGRMAILSSRGGMIFFPRMGNCNRVSLGGGNCFLKRAFSVVKRKLDITTAPL